MKILAYVEPHPIRNQYGQFTHVGRLFAQSLLNSLGAHDFDFRLFANDEVGDHLCKEMPRLSPFLLRPTISEAEDMRTFLRTWDELAIEEWLLLVHGRGTPAALYTRLLQRIHKQFAFDVVLLWAENGAVRAAARELKATVVHGELGPTRAPFPSTIYLDAQGTNGNASIIHAPMDVLERVPLVPVETWCTTVARERASQPGVMESGVLYPSDEVAQLLPRDSYVFVPLQLADDLNTLCHSPYKTPVEFIEHTVPLALSLGFDVLLKGHPGAGARPYNLAMELVALARARSFGERVRVLPTGLRPSDTMAIVAHAELVCSINSSLSFEAMLMRKRSVLMGSAVYDLGGQIRQRGLQRSRRASDEAWDARVVSALMGHYFIPTDDVRSGIALLPMIEAMHEEQRGPAAFGETFWQRWVDSFAYGWSALAPVNQQRRSSRPIAEGPDMEQLLWATASDDRSFLRIEAVFPGRCESLHAVCVDRFFIGHLDDVRQSPDDYLVRGWAVEREAHVPPALLLAIVGGEVVACTSVTASREDVALYLNNPSVAHCGFELVFKMPKSTSTQRVRLFLVSRDSAAQEIAWEAGPLPS